MTPFSAQVFTLPPVADGVGPFAHGDFLATVWKHGHGFDDELHVVADDRGAVPFALGHDTIRFAGDGDLVDYRSPVGEGTPDLIASAIREFPRGCRVVVDSLPEAAAQAVAKGLTGAGIAAHTAEHTVAAVLALPDSFDEYLAQIGKKERHETRRKRRRYEAELGPVRFIHEPDSGDLFEAFIRLHRLSPGDKGSFMTEAMAAYFADLVALDGWGVDALVDEDDNMVAGGFAFQNDNGYFLYNSAFDPGRGDVSPGVVLLSSLIELAIERGANVFDFLKGDEPYKFRMGAAPRQLFTVSGTT